VGNAHGISPCYRRIHYPIHKFPLLFKYEGQPTISFRASILRLELVIPTHSQFGRPPVVGYAGPPIELTYLWLRPTPGRNLLDQ